jgi:tRNA uracil 4-sulfurtransferase
MMYLAKIGELTLKGANLKDFEHLLVRNTRYYLSGRNAGISLRAGRMYIEGDDTDAEAVEFTLNHLIGITGWAPAVTCEKSMEGISKAVYNEAVRAKENGAKTFKLEARRSEKSFPFNSYDICREAASPVYDSGLLGVDVHNPDVTITVEVREQCYVYSDAHKGCRGLPVGSSGKGLLLLSGGLDSPVAGYRMIRRGMRIECVYFHSYPYTSMEAQQKVEKLSSILADYGLETYLNIIPFTDVQMRIKEKAPQMWTTLMLRVCMMKCANMLAGRMNAQCIITGESLGQVASQTIENMTVTEHFSEFPLLRPLVGMDKEEIVQTSWFIGSYDTSILPYEDCCVLFSPKHPVLRATVAEAEEIYRSMDIDSLVAVAFEKREVKHYTAQQSLSLKI